MEGSDLDTTTTEATTRSTPPSDATSSSPRSTRAATRRGPARIRLGFVPLTDCAPLVIARERGFFRDEGLDVVLSRETSWANVRDKLAIGALEGAQLLAPLALSTRLGIDAVDARLCVPMSLDHNGNAITVSTALAERMLAASRAPAHDVVAAARALRSVIDSDRTAGRPPLVFAVVFAYSSHNYMLREWLACGGIDPDRDVRILVAPPPTMHAMLEQRKVDGYCVGEPWNAVARARGIGRTVATSCDLWPSSPEKVLALREDWSEHEPQAARAVTRALLRACRWLDLPEHRLEAVHVIAGLSFVDAPVEVVLQSMQGLAGDLAGQPRRASDLHVFHRQAATFPWLSHAAWFVAQMLRWGQLEKVAGLAETIASVYRPDLHRAASVELGLPAPTVDWKVEGAHDAPWLLEATTQEPIAMGADRFLAAPPFDPRRVPEHLEELEISSLRVRLDELPEALVRATPR